MATVWLIALPEVIGSSDLRKLVVEAYFALRKPMQSAPELKDCYGELFSLIDRRAKHWVWLSPNQRLDVYIPWEGHQQYLENPQMITLGEATPASAEVMSTATHQDDENDF